MTIHHADPWLTIHGGDCRDVLATLPDASVHCVVTSPPYWGLRDYGVTGQLGLEATPEEYVANMVAVFREVRRVLRPDGTLWLNLGDSYAGSWGAQSRGGPPSESSTLRGNGHVGGGPKVKGLSATQIAAHPKGTRTGSLPEGSSVKPKDLVGIPWRVAFALQADGWYLRSDIIWAKPNPMPESVTDRPTKAHEYLFLMSKAPRYFYDADAVREPHAEPNPNAMTWEERKAILGHHGSTSAMVQQGVSIPSLAQHPAGRNRRTVWTVATQPYPGAHFAVMPEALVEPCILAGTSERGVCPTCGSSWERVVEREASKPQRDSYHGQGVVPSHRGGGDRPGGYYPTSASTTGWRATCDHDAEPVGAVVLDPFGGSGTVARVANRLSRRAVLIDLNPDYLAQQLERNRDMPLGLTA